MKKSFATLLLFASLWGANNAEAYTNPIISGMHPDPSVCRVGDDYYLVNSSFNFYPGVPVMHSKDLVNWEQIGYCLTRPEQLPLSGTNEWLGIYAPTIRYNNGIFYMVTTNVPKFGNFYVYTTNPAGEWSDPIKLEQDGIDPSFYFEDGKCYTLSNPNSSIWLGEIDIKTGKTTSPARQIWGGTGGRYPEGPHIFKRDGWYYLLISEGGTEYGHCITVARSRNIYGPYESHPNNPILTHTKKEAQSNSIQGTGHGDMVQAKDGSWWMVFLAFRPREGTFHVLGRETFLAPVTWTADGWPIVNDGKPIQEEMDCKSLPEVKVAETPQHLSFDKIHKLPIDWMYLRNPIESNYSFSADALRLKATNITINQNEESPSFVCRRQSDFNFSATTNVGIDNAISGDRAGITIYMSSSYHYDIAIVKNEKKGYSLKLSYQIGQISHVEKVIPLKTNRVTLRVEGSTALYKFSYSTDGKNFNQLGVANTNLISTETAGGFTGVVIGLFSESEKANSPMWADFKYFDYTKL